MHTLVADASFGFEDDAKMSRRLLTLCIRLPPTLLEFRIPMQFVLQKFMRDVSGSKPELCHSITVMTPFGIVEITQSIPHFSDSKHIRVPIKHYRSKYKTQDSHLNSYPTLRICSEIYFVRVWAASAYLRGRITLSLEGNEQARRLRSKDCTSLRCIHPLTTRADANDRFDIGFATLREDKSILAIVLSEALK